MGDRDRWGWREPGRGRRETEPRGRNAVISGRKATNAIFAISELLICIHYHVQNRQLVGSCWTAQRAQLSVL